MSAPEQPGRRPLFPWRAFTACLLVATFGLPVWLMTGKSITNDEVAHIPAGYSYLRTGIVRLNPMHPPLVKEICAFPLLFLDVNLPLPPRQALDDPNLPVTFQWDFGRHFIERPELPTILFRARLMAVLLSLGLAVVIAVWARSLWGDAGAALALSLYAFDPTITAHSQLVTTDVGFAFFSTAYLFSLWRVVRQPGAGRVVLAGLSLGLALGAKFSAIFLLPVSALLLGLAAWVEPVRFAGRDWPGALLGAGTALGAIGVLAYGVLSVIYLFPSDPLFYLRGLQTVNVDHTSDYPFFLMGELSPKGWIHYLLVAWLVKTSIPTLLLLLGAGIAVVMRDRAGLLDEAFLVVPALSLFAAYSVFSDPIGVRYVIPCLPLLYVFAGRLARAAARRRSWRIALAGMTTWVVVEYVSIWPDHLSYFNQIAGGPRGGVTWLDDSNVDWGQGLIQLREYLDRRGLDRYRFCFFQPFDRGLYGITGEWIGLEELLDPPAETLVLSAHCVARARAWLARSYGDGPENWLARTQPTAVVGHAYYVYELGAPR